jgi:hypothetical protein
MTIAPQGLGRRPNKKGAGKTRLFFCFSSPAQSSENVGFGSTFGMLNEKPASS